MVTGNSQKICPTQIDHGYGLTLGVLLFLVSKTIFAVTRPSRDSMAGSENSMGRVRDVA